MSSVTFKLLLLIIWTWFSFSILAAADPVQPPHIVFIVADDLGWNDVSWRESHMYTPTLTRLALQGIILNNSYVQPLCSPSRSAFMSGYFPFHTGLQHSVIGPRQKAYLPANLTTLPEKLKSLGYATHAIGKWHLGFCNWKYTPTFRGFDSFLGYYNAAEDYYTHDVGKYLDFRDNMDPDIEDIGRYSAYVYAERALSIIQAHDKSKPLFLYLPFQSVHEPLEVPAVYESRPGCAQTQNGTRKTKCGMVAILDEAIGNITGLLDTLGYMDNILIIFTTDNGGAVWAGGNNLPLRGAKSTLWEGGTRGTGFIYSRNLFKQTGITHEGIMHAVDWFPTIMELLGQKVPAGIDGVSQWDSLLNGSPSPRTEFVYNIDELNNNAAIRMGDWKLIQGSPGGWNDWYPVPGVDEENISPSNETFAPDQFMLFNIKDDPTEHNDVKTQYPQFLAQLQARLKEWRKSLVPANFPPPDPAANPNFWGGVWSPGWC